jgi:hypothetical protein
MGLFEEGGPTVDGGMCCYHMLNCACTGRPFIVDGVARTAPSTDRADWCAALRTRDVDDLESKAAAARAWLDDARLEHASIASFARVTLDLLTLGAPPDLVEAAQHAALDEIEHAKLCFALASRYAGRDLGPAPLSIGGAVVDADWVAFATATVREGCVGETLGALVAAERARLAEDRAVKSALERIAADEARHAALAWRMVKWAIEQGGFQVRAAVQAAFAEESHLLLCQVSASTTLVEKRSRIDGHLTEGELSQLKREALLEIIGPCSAKVAGLKTGAAFQKAC